MIDTSVEQSKICAPSAAFILGQVTSDLKAFNKLESSDIVRSLFGVESANPNAMDITEALVASIGAEDQFKIRALLQDRGISGVIWRFVTSKKFMVELSKALSSHGNFLSLSLITVDGDDGLTTAVRELVRFNKDKTEFLDKRMRSVEYNANTVDTLMEIKRQTEEELKKKYLEPEEKKVEPPAPPKAPKDICHFDIKGFESFGDKEVEYCSKVWNSVGQLIESGIVDAPAIQKWLVDSNLIKIDGKDIFYDTVQRTNDDSSFGLYTIAVRIEDSKPKTIRLTDAEPYGINYTDWKSWDDLINAMDVDPKFDMEDRTVCKVGGDYYMFINAEYIVITDLNDVVHLDRAFADYAMQLKKNEEPKEEPLTLNIVTNFEHINAVKKNCILREVHNRLDGLTLTEIHKDDCLFNAIHESVMMILGETAGHKFQYEYNLDESTHTLTLTEIPFEEATEPEKPATPEPVQPGQDVDGDQPLPPELKEELKERGIPDGDIKAVEEGKATVRDVIDLHEQEVEAQEDAELHANEVGSPAVESLESTEEDPQLPDAPEVDVLTPLDGNGEPAEPLMRKQETPPKEEVKEEPKKEYTFNILINGHETVEIADQVRTFVAEAIKRVADGLGSFAFKQEIEKNFKTKVENVDFQKPDEYTTNITITLQHIEEEQPKKEENTMKNPKIEVGKELEDCKEAIVSALSSILYKYGTYDNCCQSLDEITSELITVTELDNLEIEARDGGWFVFQTLPSEEVPGADIHDREVQEGLLRGLFGTVAPAITHVQTFLRRHLREIQNPTYLATETFPTEVMQVWDTRPYNFTVSIVKFKDGRFYRIFLATTNPGLTDPTWLATHDIPGRWVQLGSDIQESSFRPNFDRQRRRY